MRIVFFGASRLGYLCCEQLLKMNETVQCIFTIPEEFNIKYKHEPSSKVVKNYLYRDLSILGEQFGVPVYKINQNISDFQETISKLQPDFILVVGWYYQIPKKILSIPRKGAAGIHASLLPKYRGNAPLVWAMINGEPETGISLFYFDEGVDTGDIIAQKKIQIEENDTIKELLEKVEIASVQVLADEIPRIANGTASRTKQNHELATSFPKRTPEDGKIDWNWDKKRIENFIKAQTKPYPGAFTIIGDKKVTIFGAEIDEV